MAGKEATIYIIDQGSSMGRAHNGRSESDLTFSMRYIYDSIASILITGRSTLCVGVLGFRTNETSNPMQNDEGYEHIAIHQPLGKILFPDMKKLQGKIKPSKTEEGDAISAVIIAVDMMEKFTRKLKYVRKIVLVTNGLGAMDADDLEETVQRIKDDGIQLVVMGVDFDDAEFGFKEEDKPPHKRKNEAILKDFVKRCDGVFGTAAEAVQDITIPRVKEVRPYASFKGQLTLGDPANYDTAMAIDIERYTKTKVAKPPTASSYVLAAEQNVTEEDIEMEDVNLTTTGEALAPVRNQRIYYIDDPTAPGGKKEIDREDLALGYEYGRTAVAISESEHNITKLETTPCYTILGFIPQDDYDIYMNMGESCITVGARTNEKARLAISCIARTLFETNCYAVARLVLKEGKDPQLVLLAPHIEVDLEALIDLPLPFAEDFRTYQFPPLDKVISVSGGVLTKHRYLPTDPLKQAMSDFVDAMDLSTADTDDDGNPSEYMPIGSTYSPVLHRIQQAIRLRAINPDEPVQPPADILLAHSHPPPHVLKNADKSIKHLIKLSDVKKVPFKAKGRRAKETIKPLSGLDIDSLLRSERPKSKASGVDPKNAVPSFKQALEAADNEAAIKAAVRQLGDIIKGVVKDSVGDSGYARACEELRVMRNEMLDLEMPETYNTFLEGLKKDVKGEKLGGDRREFWFEARVNGCGLIKKSENELSEVTDEEAKAFWRL